MSKTPVAPRFARYFPFFGGGGGGGGGGVRPTAPPGYATVGGSIVGGSIIFSSELTETHNEPTFRVFKFLTPKKYAPPLLPGYATVGRNRSFQ